MNAPDISEDDPAPRIDFSAVHAVVQVRLVSRIARCGSVEGAVDGCDAKADRQQQYGVTAAVTAMDAKAAERVDGCVKEHFGFLDGASNPVLKKSEAGARYSNQVNLGEILCGYPNMADKSGEHAEAPKLIQDLLQDGSFLAVRKLRQDVEALDAALYAAQAQAATAGVKLTREDLMAKMMGRWPDGHPDAGQPLAEVVRTEPPSNDFHFDADKAGAVCPFHAHIRRVNPRDRNPEPGSRSPRLVRRGMSYGPPRSARRSDQERGLIFMAYNASLGEQFEVVQRWINGGNSSGSYSGQSDPIFGLAEPGRQRYFRFEHQGANRPRGSRRFGPSPRRATTLRASGMGSVSVRSFQKRAGDPQGAGRGAIRQAARDMECDRG